MIYAFLDLKKIKNTRSVEFFLDMGYDENAAKSQLTKKQDTRSIKSIQKRYKINIEQARQIQQNINQRGYETFLNNHSKEEIQQIQYTKGKSRRIEYYLIQINKKTNNYYTEEKLVWRNCYDKKTYEEILEKDQTKRLIAENNGHKIFYVFDYEK